MQAHGRVREEREGSQPDVVALDRQRGEFERALRCQHENGTVEWIRRSRALGKGVVIFHVQDGLDFDCEGCQKEITK